MVTRNIQEAKKIITSKFAEGSKIISVDGWTGAGKSTFTESFAGNDDIEIISFDDYLERNSGKYLEVFNFNALENIIITTVNSGKQILIEGICMNEVLQNISVECDFKVYIKELGIFEDWYYEKYLNETKTTEEIFAEDDKEPEVNIYEESNSNMDKRLNDDADLSQQRKGMFYDLVSYHRDYKPQDNCDLLIERLYKNV
jgi:hypothetical protein